MHLTRPQTYLLERCAVEPQLDFNSLTARSLTIRGLCVLNGRLLTITDVGRRHLAKKRRA